MIAEGLLSCFYIVLFIWIIKRWRFFSIPELNKNWIAGVFVLKILCGIILQLIYTRYYPNRNEADIFKYFDDSAVVYNSFFDSPKYFFQMLFGINSSAEYLQMYYQKMSWWTAPYHELFYNEARTMIRLNTLMRIFSFGYYNVHVVFINFLSLIGLTGIFKIFYDSLKEKKKELFFGVFLIPSVLLWGSGLLKESFEFFVLGMLLYVFHKTVHDRITASRVFLLLLFLLLHVLIKFYILVALIPGLLSYYRVTKTGYKNVGLKFFVIHLVYFLILLNLHYIVPAINVPELISSQYHKYLRFAEQLQSGSLIVVNEMQPTLISLLKNSFRTFFTVLIHPHLFESKTILMLFSAIENLFILLFLIISVFTYSYKTKINNPLFWFSLFLAVIIFTLVGLTTPVLGTIVRYKVPAMPFLMFVLIYMYNKEKLFQLFPFLKKTHHS